MTWRFGVSKPVVFISYSHKDEEWKELLVGYLNVLQQEALLDPWDDRHIEFGDDWRPRIFEAISSAEAAVLLVSVNFLNSKFITTEEIPAMLERREKDGMKIFPVIVSDCPWRRVRWLSDIQSRPKDGRALADLRGNARNKALTEIVTEIADVLNRPVPTTRPQQDISPLPMPEPYQRVPTLPPSKLFVGRKKDLAKIEERLKSRGVIGVVSLRGTAGVGKSALALEAAYRFAPLFPDGRYWVDLRGGDAANAVRSLLRQLNVPVPIESRFDDLIFTAGNALANKRALVILDNAEAIDQNHLEQMINLCATTIVTSRVSIDTTMEIAVDKLEDDDALDLLRERGADIEAERDLALKLIARLGGLALALEITARRMAAYRPRQSCAEALEELSCRRHFVEAIKLPLRNAREDNIVEAFALSYRKLNDEMKAAFHALGLCSESGAPVEAIARMLDLKVTDAHDLLLALALWSLADFNGSRAMVHPVLHSYAEMCAREHPERVAEMIERHVRYFGWEIGGAYQRALNNDDGAGQDRALSQADSEIDNVQIAQIRALEADFSDPELAVELTDNLQFYWRLRDEPQVYNWLLRTRLLAQQTSQQQREANVLQAIGDVQSFRDDKDAALKSNEEALKLFTQVGAKLGQANVLKAIGDVQSFRDDKDAALKSNEEALKLFTQVGAKLGQANVLQAIGDVQSFRDDKDAALKSYEEALKLFTQVGAKLGQANVCLSKGKVINSAEEFEEAVRLYEEIDHTYSIARGKAFYGEWLLDNGDTEQALKLLGEARAGFAQIIFEGGVDYVDEILNQVGNTDRSEDD
jgi:tetratricopeptide (TPR) repeat protein